MQEKEYTNCFACGQQNNIGLKLEFEYNDDKAICNFSLNSDFEGYPGIIHGGIVSTILDEAMAKIILVSELKAVTVEMKTRFKQNMLSKTLYTVEAEIIKQKGRAIFTKATIIDDKSKAVAYSEATFFKVK